MVREGTVKEAGLTSGSEVEMVTSVDLDKVVKVLKIAISHRHQGESDFEFTHFLQAVRLLDQLAGLSSNSCPELLSLIGDGTVAFYKVSGFQSDVVNGVEDQLDVEIGDIQCTVLITAAPCIATAKALGRACGDPVQRAEQLMARMENNGFSFPDGWAVVVCSV